MSKLYVIMEGLIGISTPANGNPMVLMVKTYPTDRDGLKRPLMPHFPRVNFRENGQLKARALDGEDIRFELGAPAAAAPVLDLSRLPSFAQILAFAPKAKGKKPAPNTQINTGCIGGAPGTACLVPKGTAPRLAGRVLIETGNLRSMQVDDNGNPFKAPPTRYKFLFTSNSKGPALDMQCDNALLLKIDAGNNPVRMMVGKDEMILSNALPNEKSDASFILDDPDEDCVMVRVTDLVDPIMAKQMKMEDGADFHFPIFFDLLPNYTGPKVIPTLIQGPKPGDPPLSRCIPPNFSATI